MIPAAQNILRYTTAIVFLFSGMAFGQTQRDLVTGNLIQFNSVTWNAPSGVYFCRINAGDYSKTMKMMELK